MATYYSTEVQNELDKTLNARQVGNGEKQVKTFSHVTPVSLAQNDLIYLSKLDKETRILGGKVAWSASGGSNNIEVGTIADPDRYLASTSLNTAGNADLAANVATFINDDITSSTEYLVAKVVSAAGCPAGVTIKGSFEFIN